MHNDEWYFQMLMRLIIVLVVVLFVLVIVLVVFRESFEEYCCYCSRNQSGRPSGSATGLRNPAFENQEQRLPLPAQRPFNLMEAVESPPTYEEAMKHELFRFRPPLADHRTRSSSLGEIILHTPPSGRQRSTTEGAPSTSNSQTDAPQPQPSSSQGSSPCMRKRGSSSSITMGTQLSTINEEETEENQERQFTVVIDCIGIQASRLVENCNTSIELANGCELGVHSSC